MSKNGRFTNSQKMEDAKDQYKRENDSVEAFENDCIERMQEDAAENTVTKADLYKDYKHYAEESGLQPVSRKKFSRKFKELGYEEARRRKYSLLLSEAEYTKQKPERCFIKLRSTRI